MSERKFERGKLGKYNLEEKNELGKLCKFYFSRTTILKLRLSPLNNIWHLCRTHSNYSDPSNLFCTEECSDVNYQSFSKFQFEVI